jgi:ABC-type transport system involved in multi-copper enzyme maturation permease subunit
MAMNDEINLGMQVLSWLSIVPIVALAAWLVSSFVVGLRHRDELVRRSSLAILCLALVSVCVVSSYQFGTSDLILLPRMAEAVIALFGCLGLAALAGELARRGSGAGVVWGVTGVGVLALLGTAAAMIVEMASIRPEEFLINHALLAVGHLVGAAALVVGVLLSARHVPVLYGFQQTLSAIAGLIGDLGSLSGRRVLAVAKLAVKEAIRRKVLIVLLLFFLIFMFAGWYITYKDNQVRVLVSFVSKVTGFFVTLVAIIMAATSLPQDVASKTIHTVVTKPVRRMEILLGRVVGYVGVVTFFLVLMGVVSLFYVQRTVDERQRKHMIARVPIYGKLHFEQGKGERRVEKTRMTNVGYENSIRSYIAGAPSTQTAVWEFQNIDPSLFGDAKALNLEMSFAVFRSTKGVLGEGVVAQLTFINPATGKKSADPPTFTVTEYRDKNRRSVPREYVSEDGRLRIECRCLSGSQYIGMAGKDLYLLPSHRSFAANFVKGLMGTWMQAVVVIVVAVSISTFLSGVISMLVTIGVFFAGNITDYLANLAKGQVSGGGPIEAARRIVDHQNVVTELPDDLWTNLARGADNMYKFVLDLFRHVIPDMTQFDLTSLVANGFNIPGDVIVQGLVFMLGYALPCIIFGCFCLKAREIAK